MKYHKDHAIVLARVDYGERDRILTLLGQTSGKFSVLAKGVRAEKSRLAGGIELLSESEVSFVDSRSNIKTLTGARLKSHYRGIARDIHRMQQAFDHIKVINSIVDDEAGQEYYHPLLTVFKSLDNPSYDRRLIDIWFNMQVLQLSGSVPNLRLDANEESETFIFDYDKQQFISSEGGIYQRNDLKLLRLCISQLKPPKLEKQLGSEDRLQTLVRTLLKTNVTEV